MSGGIDSGSKNGSSKAKKGTGFLDGLKSFGSSVLEGFLGGVEPSSSGRPSVDRRDPVAARDRPAAAKQIHRSLKAWRDKDAEGDASAEKSVDAENAEYQTADEDELAAEPAPAAAASASEGGGTEGQKADASAEGVESRTETSPGADPVADAPKETPAEVAPKSMSAAAKLKGVHRKVFRSAADEAEPEQESAEAQSAEQNDRGEGDDAEEADGDESEAVARKIHRSPINASLDGNTVARYPGQPRTPNGRFAAGGLPPHADPSVVIEAGKYMLPIAIRGDVRKKLYGTNYRSGVDTWLDGVVKAATDPKNKNMWKYKGTWYDKTTPQGIPTIGHKQKVCDHWNGTGNNTDHDTRKNFYNGDGNPGTNLEVQPRTVNCGDNCGTFLPEVKAGYRGP